MSECFLWRLSFVQRSTDQTRDQITILIEFVHIFNKYQDFISFYS